MIDVLSALEKVFMNSGKQIVTGRKSRAQISPESTQAVAVSIKNV